MSGLPSVIVLLSGGIDSAACVSFFQQQGNPVSALFVDYGQIAARKERNAASEISRYFRIELVTNPLRRHVWKRRWIVLQVGTRVVFLALTQTSFDSGLISMGVHSVAPTIGTAQNSLLKPVRPLLHGVLWGQDSPKPSILALEQTRGLGVL